MKTALSILSYLLFLSAAAAAQDACLSGASTLGDQRAIATLRTNLEASCPCGTFTRRGLYQRCAKDVIATALSSSALRAQCADTAKKIRTGASCGTTKVTCGRFQADDDTPLTCR